MPRVTVVIGVADGDTAWVASILWYHEPAGRKLHAVPTAWRVGSPRSRPTFALALAACGYVRPLPGIAHIFGPAKPTLSQEDVCFPSRAIEMDKQFFCRLVIDWGGIPDCIAPLWTAVGRAVCLM